ncbi:glycosidase [Arthrobacter sp. CJ23]|uniref:pullulanase X25 domain-containing protein n=1 Tax=Arthrobacter sp. CJ23 TaxID=2972479 RepID=UPI00215CF738|nr:glycosidase [Arthrobacter sp. CJ23]UVJ40538.1 glycosidase [Arthrobacter sp. CJ23]
MGANTAENTNLRLQAVLEILAEGVWSGDSLNAGEVLAQAIDRIPFNTHEAELLSGGVPRGHKTLTTASAKLVKAGWLVKGRSGWTIPDDGLRATVAFANVDAFAEALDAGTPVPSDVAVPTAPPKKAAAPKRAAAPKKAAAAKTATAKTAAPKAAAAAKAAPKKTTTRKAPAKAAPAPAVELLPQPDAVAIAGDFNVLLGAPEDWAPQYDEAQMAFDAKAQLWTLTAELPAGFYTYKIALNRAWDENYGAFGVLDGANHELQHGGGKVTFTYNHATRDIVTA